MFEPPALPSGVPGLFGDVKLPAHLPLVLRVRTDGAVMCLQSGTGLAYPCRMQDSRITVIPKQQQGTNRAEFAFLVVCVCVCFRWTIQNHFLSLTAKLCVCWPFASECCFIQCRDCLWSAGKPTALVFWFTFFIDCPSFCYGPNSDRTSCPLFSVILGHQS